MNNEVEFFAILNQYMAKTVALEIPIMALKAIAISILLVTWVTEVGDGWINANSVIRSRDSHGKGLNIWGVLGGLFLLAILASYDQIIDMIEHIFAELSTVLSKNVLSQQSAESYQAMFKKILEPDPSSIWSTISKLNPINQISNLIDYLNPFNPNGLLIQIAYLFDMFVFLFFLARRSFKILVWKLLFPVVLLAYFFKNENIKQKANNYLIQGLKLYLLILPFLMVNVFCLKMYELFFGGMATVQGNIYATAVIDSSQGILLTFMVFIKISLFRMAENKMMDKLF